jgi:hypothetical protein
MGWSKEKIRDFSVTMSHEKSEKTTTVNLTSSTSFSLGIIKAFISKRIEMSTTVLEAITFLNHLFAASPTKDCFCIGRKFFTHFDNDVSRFRDGVVEFRTGLFQAVHFGGHISLTLNIDVTTGVFWNSSYATVLDLAGELLRLEKRNISPRAIQPARFRDLEKRLKGLRFSVPHLGGRCFTIHKLTQETARHHIFTKADGTRTTVENHCHTQHNLSLRYPLANLVATQGGQYYPMELCCPVLVSACVIALIVGQIPRQIESQPSR